MMPSTFHAEPKPYAIAFSTLRSLTSIRAGKTTVLRHLLQNAAGMKFGCVINDVASVNVDAKLVRNDRNRGGQGADAATTTSDLADTVELSNGCACEPFACMSCCRWACSECGACSDAIWSGHSQSTATCAVPCCKACRLPCCATLLTAAPKPRQAAAFRTSCSHRSPSSPRLQRCEASCLTGVS